MSIAGVGVRFIVELEAGKPTIRFAAVLRVIAALGDDVRLIEVLQILLGALFHYPAKLPAALWGSKYIHPTPINYL